MNIARAIAGVLAGSIPAASILVLAMSRINPCIGASRWDICSQDDDGSPPCYYGACDVFEPWWWKVLRPVVVLGLFAAAGAIAHAISRTRFPVAAAVAGASTGILADLLANYVYPYGPKSEFGIVGDLLEIGFCGVLGAAGGWLFAHATRER